MAFKTKKSGAMVFLAALLFAQNVTLVANAADPNFGDPLFNSRWVQQDRLVGSSNIQRPYTWGPSAPGASQAMFEAYMDSPAAQRKVQYFDKARMEINNPTADSGVTTGLLVKELVSGRRQDGDNKFTDFAPSKTQVAGDPVVVNPNAPVYGSFKNVVTLGNADSRSRNNALGTTIVEAISKDGTITRITPPEAIQFGAYESVTGHNIAQPFQDFKNIRGAITNPSSGTTVENQPIYTDNPTVNVFGLAITEPYWVNTKVAGVDTTVLVQLFERRVLTYNPNLTTNKVEMGNLGQHYYQWRYVENANQVAAIVPLDYSQYRANYNKSSSRVPMGGTGNVLSYATGSTVISSSPAIALEKNLAVIGTDTNGLHGINIDPNGSLNNVFIFKANKNPAFNADPAIYNGMIYAGASDGAVYAIDLDSKGTNVVEKSRTALNMFGVRGSVAFSPDGKQLYYVAGQILYAVQTDNLAIQKWERQSAGGMLSAPAVDASGNVFVGSADGKLFAYKPDGTSLSSVYPIKFEGALDKTMPVLANNSVYVNNGAGKITRINPTNGVTIWSRDVSPLSEVNSTLAVSNGMVFVGTDGSKVQRLRDSDGSLLTPDLTTGGKVRSSVAVMDGFYYFGDDEGKLYKVDVNLPANRTELLTTGSFGTNSPVVADGRVFVASSIGVFYIVK